MRLLCTTVLKGNHEARATILRYVFYALFHVYRWDNVKLRLTSFSARMRRDGFSLLFLRASFSLHVLCTFHCFATCQQRNRLNTTVPGLPLVTNVLHETHWDETPRRGETSSTVVPVRSHSETRYEHDCPTPYHGSAATTAALPRVAARTRTKWWGKGGNAVRARAPLAPFLGWNPKI